MVSLHELSGRGWSTGKSCGNPADSKCLWPFSAPVSAIGTTRRSCNSQENSRSTWSSTLAISVDTLSLSCANTAIYHWKDRVSPGLPVVPSSTGPPYPSIQGDLGGTSTVEQLTICCSLPIIIIIPMTSMNTYIHTNEYNQGHSPVQ